MIGILAAITIVAYNGIQSRAVAASLSSALEGANKLLKIDQVTNSAYPTTLALANGGNGLPASAGTTYQYGVNNGTNPQSFCVTATTGGQSYNIDQTGNLLAGGQNLFQKSATLLAYSSGSDYGDPAAVYSVDAVNGDYQTYTNTPAGNRYWWTQESASRQPGTTYTISLEINTTVAGWYGYWYPSEQYTNLTFPNTGGAWQRWSWTYTQTGATAGGNPLFGFHSAIAGSSISFRKLKLEVGSPATCWASEP